MEETAALLGATAIKQRLAGVTGLLEQLRKREAGQRSPEYLSTLIPHVLPCLRDHNSKIAQSALEILELLVAQVPEATVRSYFKLLWISLVERLGDSKLPVREKAAEVVVEISVALDVSTVLEKLKACTRHKNWRTREQTLHAIWRCLERHALFNERKEEFLDEVLKLLEDSSKEVRAAAMTALEKFYLHIGPSLLSDLECKSIRAAHMKTLTDRFERISAPGGRFSAQEPTYREQALNSDAFGSDSALPDELSSILSSYDLQVASSSSMARYLASVRSRTLSEAKAAAASAGGERSPSQASSTSSKVTQDSSATAVPWSDSGISDKEIQKQLATIFEKLQLDNNWAKRVDGLKILQKLVQRCHKASNSDVALPALSQGLRPIRERLCEQVSDLRSSVSREACQTIQSLANLLRDEFNPHAEGCLGNLLKATYVTIQVISTSADTTIRSMIESTSNGYLRVIPKLIECAKSRNQVLRCNSVCYLTLALQRWSASFLSKHSDMFLPILPALLQDAIGDVRAQSRKCYWAYHHLFPEEANSLLTRLDGSTQKNVRDDPSRYKAGDMRQSDLSSSEAPASQPADPIGPSTARNARVPQPPVSAPASLSSALLKESQPTGANAQRVLHAADAKLPRRVLGASSNSTGSDTVDDNAQSSRMLSQGPMRVGLGARPKSSSTADEESSSAAERKKAASAGPLRVRSAPKTSMTAKTAAENVFSTRQEPSNASFHSSSHTGTAATRAQRVQLATETEMEVDEGSNTSKRLPQTSTSSEKATDSTASDLTTDSTASKARPTAAMAVKPAEGPQPTQDRLEEALRHMESSSWATRLAAVEYLGKGLDQSSKGGNSEKVDDRIVATFIKHLGDPHYRVAQGVLKHFLPLLKLSTERQQIVPHLKAILPKLFQKFVDTKESIRAIAKENLEYVASAVENSVLTGLVIPMLGDGSNMKVKAAMCHYLRELLPGATGYMKQGTNTSHMRSFLLKIALLVDAEVPVSVASACGELLAVAAKLYGSEMDTALSLLPPSKRVVVSKVLKTRRIVLNFSSQRPPTSVPRSTRSRNGGSEPQSMETTAEKPERSRKRPESPNANASSPAPSSQKRINTTAQSPENYPEQWRNLVVANPVDESTGNSALLSTAAFSSALFASIPSSEQHSTPFEDVLEVLEQNNASESERKSALYKTFHLIETGSKDLWDQYFDRLLLLLLEAATEKDVRALKVLQRLVEAQGSRTQECFDLVLTRLLVSVGDQVDVARHLMERILRDLVGSASDQQQALATLAPLISSTEPPALQVVLRLVKGSLEACERGSPATTAFLRRPETATRLMEALTLRLGHVSSNVRKNAVDCLVAFHFATKEDSALLPKYLSAELDDTRRRLVEIFIDRAKMERHHNALAT